MMHRSTNSCRFGLISGLKDGSSTVLVLLGRQKRRENAETSKREKRDCVISVQKLVQQVNSGGYKKLLVSRYKK